MKGSFSEFDIFRRRALSSPPTPYQVVNSKRQPEEHFQLVFSFQKRLQGFCVTSSVPILCLTSKAGAELCYSTVKSLIDIGSDMFPVMQTLLDLISSHLVELVLVHASVQPMVKTLVCCTCHAMMLPATSTTTSTRHCLFS